MDHDTANKLTEPVTFECQVCGFKSIFVNETIDEIHELTSSWCTHFIELKDCQLSVTTCPGCADRPIHKLFDGYQARIRSGADLRYH